jgi:Zn finger protein HypA/HybF involved in hydrogenase expression
MDIATIFRKHFPAYVKRFGSLIPSFHLKAVNAIMQCRTQVMGGNVYFCESCRIYHYAYHSCKNRHCPKCGGKDTKKWLDKQLKKLLPLNYYMVTFTIPEELRCICRSNQKLFYSILFKASSDALKTLLGDPQYAGGKAGFVGVLHTWTRLLMYHPHIHYIVPAGAFDVIRNVWNKSGHQFLIPVKALSKIFRENFRTLLKKRDPDIFQLIPADIWYTKGFNTNSEKKGSGKQALLYLSRYIYRTAISNNRILSDKNGKVTFQYKPSGENQYQTINVSSLEFIRRFLQHVLPVGFQKVRYYGFLNGSAKSDWEQLKAYFQLKDVIIPDKPEQLETHFFCPKCKTKMILVASYLRPSRAPPQNDFIRFLRHASYR